MGPASGASEVPPPILCTAMPNYEYVCVNCGNRVEVYQRIGDDPLRICDVCGGDLRKVFHPAGIVFKGSGFYKTDSRKPSKAGAESSGKESSGSDSSAKGDGKSPEKPKKKEAS